MNKKEHTLKLNIRGKVKKEIYFLYINYLAKKYGLSAKSLEITEEAFHAELVGSKNSLWKIINSSYGRNTFHKVDSVTFQIR